MIRLAIRGFAGGQLRFEDWLDVEEAGLDILPAVAEKHANALAGYGAYMIEIEFVDEPDINQRFFRFGTDPSGMPIPLQINLDKVKPQ